MSSTTPIDATLGLDMVEEGGEQSGMVILMIWLWDLGYELWDVLTYFLFAFGIPMYHLLCLDKTLNENIIVHGSIVFDVILFSKYS